MAEKWRVSSPARASTTQWPAKRAAEAEGGGIERLGRVLMAEAEVFGRAPAEARGRRGAGGRRAKLEAAAPGRGRRNAVRRRVARGEAPPPPLR